MPTVPKETITSVRLVLRVDGDPHFLVALSSGGHTKRMGYSSLSRYEGFVATGRLDGAFQSYMGGVSPGILDHAGVYEDPGTEGSRCQWRIEFDGDSGPIRFDLTYHSGSAGLPAAMARLVEGAEKLTEAWYDEQIPADDPSPEYEDPTSGVDTEPVVAATDPAGPVRGGLTLKEYFSFSGRIGRMDYIMLYGLPLLVLGLAGSFADGFLGLASEEQIGPLGVVASVVSIWPGMAGWSKRLHDFDTSLWVVPGIVVLGGVLMGIAAAMSPFLLLAAGVVWGLALLVLTFATYFWPGTQGPNRFGPPRAV